MNNVSMDVAMTSWTPSELLIVLGIICVFNSGFLF